jgi:FkbM family methyltransferase
VSLKNKLLTHTFFRSLAHFLKFKYELSWIFKLFQTYKTRCPQNDLELEIMGGKLVSARLLRETQGMIVSAGVGTDLDFELKVIKKTGKKVLALDPTETSLKHYLKVARVNRRLCRNLVFKNKALSIDGNDLRFFSGDGDRMASTSDSHSIGNSNEMLYKSVALNELLEQKISYLKMDIEGYEYKILESLDAPLSIPQIAIEFHHFCIPERTLSESMKWTELLKTWGYTAYDFGSWAGRSRKLPKYTSLNSDLNVEILFIKEGY